MAGARSPVKRGFAQAQTKADRTLAPLPIVLSQTSLTCRISSFRTLRNSCLEFQGRGCSDGTAAGVPGSSRPRRRQYQALLAAAAF